MLIKVFKEVIVSVLQNWKNSHRPLNERKSKRFSNHAVVCFAVIKKETATETSKSILQMQSGPRDEWRGKEGKPDENRIEMCSVHLASPTRNAIVMYHKYLLIKNEN